MNVNLLKQSVIWGVALWLIGYILGILLFAVVPPAVIGWYIMPFGILITLFVLVKKITLRSVSEYVWLAVMWTAIAIIFDYFFLVKVFKPTDGYYKLDVYIYYGLTFALPIIVGWKKQH